MYLQLHGVHYCISMSQFPHFPAIYKNNDLVFGALTFKSQSLVQSSRLFIMFSNPDGFSDIIIMFTHPDGFSDMNTILLTYINRNMVIKFNSIDGLID